MKTTLLPLSIFSLAVSMLLGMEKETIEERIGSQYENFSLVRLVGDLSHPWAVAFLGDGRYLISERSGSLILIDEEGHRHEVDGIPDDLYATNQGGLLDVVTHPEYENNGWIYLTYSQGTSRATATTLIRARLEGTSLVDREELFTQDRTSQPGRHYGSRILFTDTSTLLMTIGDRGVEPDRAQDTLDHAGSILRLRDDGSIPEDNPFLGNPNYHPEIFTYGHRNIQGIALHPETGEVWVTDHGARGGDRLDRIDAGLNYGWPIATPSRNYGDESPIAPTRVGFGQVPPVHEFLPTLAPSGLAFADSGAFPDWEGNLLAGGLRSRHIQRVVLGEGPLYKFSSGQRTITIEGPYMAHSEMLLNHKIGRIRDVRTGPEGNVYILTDQSDGGLYRLSPVR